MARTSSGSHAAGPEPDINLLAKLGYEPRDIALNTLVKWLFALFVFIGVASGFALVLYNLFVPKYSETQMVSPLKYVRTVPQNPQLQARPRRDMIDYWAREDTLIKKYTPAENGTVNLPIGQAMDLLAERGISGVTGPVQPAPPVTSAYPGSGAYGGPKATPGGSGGGFSPANVLDGVSGNFEGSATPNPFYGNPIPSPYRDAAPAPAATDIQPAAEPASAG